MGTESLLSSETYGFCFVGIGIYNVYIVFVAVLVHVTSSILNPQLLHTLEQQHYHYDIEENSKATKARGSGDEYFMPQQVYSSARGE